MASKIIQPIEKDKLLESLIREFVDKVPRGVGQIRVTKQYDTLTRETPIYYDPIFEKYFYPASSLTETLDNKRQIITCKPPVEYDSYNDSYFDPITYEKYIRAETLDEFTSERRLTRKKPLDEILRDRRKANPIYYDPKEDYLFYPYYTLYEMEETPRELIKGSVPLEFDPQEKNYYNLKTKERYIKVENPLRYKELRKEVQLKRRERFNTGVAEETPIYFDQTYYYPKISFGEELLVPREVKMGLPPADKEEYVQLPSPKEFKEFRDTILRRIAIVEKSILAEQTPIYFDTKGHKYFYPVIATQEVTDEPRRLNKSPTNPLEYDSTLNLYYYPIIGQWYILVKEVDDFKKIRGLTLARGKYVLNLQGF